MKFKLFLSSLFLALSLGAAPAQFNGATPLEWSQRMAKSEISRLGNALEAGNPKARWDYTSSLFALSVWKLGERLGDESMLQFGDRAVSSFIKADGSIKTYKLEEYNIDQVNPGKVVLALYAKTKEERLKKAAELLRSQMKTHPRTTEGGFWHKKRYPHQMWLDGLYMASPFLAHYGVMFDEPALIEDVANQIKLIDKHLYDAKTGLYFHGWDEQRAQAWADKTTGLSPCFWSRSIGWYAMAIVDSLDFISASQPELDEIVNTLRRVADGVAKYQDAPTGLWWQVTDQGARQGNYLEATGSAMFVYTLAKGVNRGYLPREIFESVILKGYAGIVRDLIKTDAKGLISLTRNCNVAGLGYTNNAGRSRDGSFEYYISEPIVDNDHKGVGPFILAGIEVQAMLDGSAKAIVRQATGWGAVEQILARIKAPQFADKDFPITSFGAKAGDSDCTEAIAKAIAACSAAGGGRVIIPAGLWPTGAIILKSNVNLHLLEGSTLSFIPDPAKYPVVLTRWEGIECMNFSSLIYAFEQENIAITGKGTLDGGATWENWWDWNNKKQKPSKQQKDRDALLAQGEAGVPVDQRVYGLGHFLRPNFIQPYRCKNILIEGVKIIRSPMWELHPVLSSNITIRGVDIRSDGPNNDGCDPESCRDVLIEDCIFDTGDDCIAIKSGRNNDGRRLNVPSENFIIRNCIMKEGHGGVVLGSEISGGCRNVFVENCTMDSPNLDRALRLKSNAVRGGVLENIYMRNVKIGQVKEAVLTVDLLYEEGEKGAFPPTIRNVVIENVTSNASPSVMFIRGFKGAVIEGISFSNCEFLGVTSPEVVQGAGLITMRNVTIKPAKPVKSANSVAPAGD